MIVIINKLDCIMNVNKKTCTLSVNENLAPFPWQYLVVLCNRGDSVRNSS